MFCTKCGHKNAQEALFCVSCGNALVNTDSSNLQQPSSQPAASQQAVPPAGAYGAYPPPKKSKTGLIIGLCVGGAVIIAAAVVLVILLTGGKGIAGEWYSAERDETLELNSDGTVEITTPYGDFEGKYEYNKGSGEGVITIDGDDFDFVVDEDEIDVDDIGVFINSEEDGQRTRSITGEWYCEDLEEVIEFFKDGTVEIYSPYNEYEGEYKYNEGSGKGVITIDGEDYDFVVDKDEVDVEDIGVYTKE